MAVEQLIAPIVSVGGLAIAMTTTWLTVRQYYDKRRVEDRQRQLEEVARLQTDRQRELDEYATAKQKSYAAERDFQHLMRQYDALTLNITSMMEYQKSELSTLEDDLRDVKGMMQVLLTQLGASDTAVMHFLKKSDP
jgi:Asp-tRNA(Asn)/Glu-tRNA(Gln) amidotransferase A subunit family amidase